VTLIGAHEGTNQLRHGREIWWVGYLAIVAGGLMISAIGRARVATPFLGVSLALVLLLLLGWLILPRPTLYATLFLTAVSDIVTVWWFPFVKNLSSRESISYLADSLTISPLDIGLLAGTVISTVRRYANTRTLLPASPLTWPLVGFTGFLLYGFARGMATGGNLRVAVLEARPLFYILMVFVIILNECNRHAHLRYAWWAVLAGVFVQSLISIDYLNGLSASQRDSLESLNEHGSTIGHNVLFVTLLGLVLLGVKRPLTKWLLLIAAVPTIYVYFVAQRRAGVASLVIAGAALAIVLFWRRRRAFWVVTPLVAVLLAGYVGAFWNSTSAAAFPAQAIKTIIAPNSASAEDRSSDLYRIIEAFDLNYTIRTDPIQGLGFGRAFYRPVPLADISFFELNAYMPHNSVLWIWIKLGFLGFVAMFYLFAKAIMLGVARIRELDRGVDLVITTTAVLFVVMYAVYSYVDVSWDARNTVFLGLALATCVGVTRRDDPSALTEHTAGGHEDQDRPAV
jgi:O-antigen ligase